MPAASAGNFDNKVTPPTGRHNDSLLNPPAAPAYESNFSGGRYRPERLMPARNGGKSQHRRRKTPHCRNIQP